MPDNAQPAAPPHDHQKRLARVRLSLEGLSVGDAFGQASFGFGANVVLATGLESIPRPWLAARESLPL